jgi:conjugal transfer mating pair stabilization protein TraG
MLEVFTVGGGDYLVNTFNAIASWTGSGGFKSLIRVVMVMGLIYALLVTAMDMDWRVWFRWFIQSALIYSALMVPTVTVKVTDRVNPGLAPSVVANVPIGLGVMASFTSQVSDYLTRTAETVFVMPASLNYSNGGFIYGARLWDKIKGFEIRDPVFKSNLDTFLKQCAYFDILLGTKSLKDLSQSTDLWADLGVNAAQNRGMKFATDTGAGTVDFEGVTCQDGWTRINNQWNNQIDTYALPFARSLYPKLTAVAASGKLANDLPIMANLLTGTATPRNDILRQKSMVDAFEAAQLDFGDASADSYALQRADTQSRNAMTTAAEQGMTWIPVLNIVLTVVFYALFPIVFPLFLFPKTGVATLKGYFAGFFYLAAWGPLYVLIHMFVMDRLASQGTAVATGGTSLINYQQMDAVNQDIATMAGFLMLSVPVLALMVMRGTMSVASSVGSMMTPVQSGGDAAAVERTTGNYAYGDVSMSNYNANNRQVGQWNTAPSFAMSGTRISRVGDDGRSYTEYGNGRTVVNASGGMDVLPFKPMFNRGYTSDLRAQGQEFLAEADRIENGTSQTWVSSRGRFGSSTSADSSASGDRWERGKRTDRTNTTSGMVTVQGVATEGEETRTYDGTRITQANRRLTGDSERRDWTYGITGDAKLGGNLGLGGGDDVPGASLRGGVGLNGGLSKTGSDYASFEQSREAAGVTDHGTTKSDGTSGSVTVSGSSGTSTSSSDFSSSSSYGDTSHTQTDTTGTDWRISEGDERRRAAAEYREIGNRMIREASYSESHGFQVSSDMSNLLSDRYDQVRRENPEMMLPELSDPNLSYAEMQRRDAGIQFAMDDLMGDLKSRRLSELGDVSGIGSMDRTSPVGTPGDGLIGVGAFNLRSGGDPAPVAALPSGESVDYELVQLGRGERAELPVAGPVRSGLGGRVHPVDGGVSQHNGIDIAAAQGTPIRARGGGTVVTNDFQARGAGNYLVVDHGNGVQTKYFHMSERSPLGVGSRVEDGQSIGSVGSTGKSTGPHLHYELWKDGAPVDPRQYKFRPSDN